MVARLNGGDPRRGPTEGPHGGAPWRGPMEGPWGNQGRTKGNRGTLLRNKEDINKFVSLEHEF